MEGQWGNVQGTSKDGAAACAKCAIGSGNLLASLVRLRTHAGLAACCHAEHALDTWCAYIDPIRQQSCDIRFCTHMTTCISPPMSPCPARRFAYATGPWLGAAHRRTHTKVKREHEGNYSKVPKSASLQPVTEWPYEDDAFSTILQVSSGKRGCYKQGVGRWWDSWVL